MIVETIVTTVGPSGEPHFAAMGVLWGDDRITIRPYLNTRTYRNLTASREAVVNVTDDVLLFVESALTHEPLPSVPARRGGGVVLRDACHWREVVVEDIVAPEATGRAEVVTRVVERGERRPFAGLCRAKHALVEASILASRRRLLPLEEILGELGRLDVLVEKTGGPREREAMAFIRAYLGRTRPAGHAPVGPTTR